IASNSVDSALFQTQDTLYLTNNGTMFAQPGFLFDTHTATGSRAADSFNNTGAITALDAPTVAFWAYGYLPTAVPSQPPGTGGVLLWNGTTDPYYMINSGSGTNQPVPSALEISAANIANSGTMLAGDLGDEQLSGATIDLSGGGLGAGSLSETDTNATTARGVVAGYNVAGVMDSFYSPPAETYDICWALDNGSSYQDDIDYIYDSLYYLSTGLADEVITPGFPIIGINNAGALQGDTRNGYLEGYSLENYGFDPESIFPINTPLNTTTVAAPAVTPVWTVSAYYYELLIGNSAPYTTNYYYNILCVNTAFADPDITAQVEFCDEEGGFNTVTNGNAYALEGMIRFSAPVTDVLTGQVVTNSIYVLDTAGIQVPAVYSTNATYQDLGIAKPIGFEITRDVPMEWTYQIPADEPIFDPTVLITDVTNLTVPTTNSFYVAQVGRNPERRDGLDPYTAMILGTAQTGLPDITNEPGRIEINASQTLVMSNMRMRGNGFVTLNAPTLLGTPAATDFGNWNANLGNVKTPLLISNLFPAAFHRPRGDIAVYTCDWFNVVTNQGSRSNGLNTYYHVLIVDQDLRDTFAPTGLNLALSGSSVVVDDPLRVMGSFLIQATNLTINSNLVLFNNAGALHTGNVPGLKTLLIGSGGSIQAENNINLGVAQSATPANPTKLNTPLLSITNLGLIASGEIDLQSQIFVLGGSMVASNGSSVVLNAITNYLGAGRGLTNSLAADLDITLSGTSIQVTNSTILAGQAGNGRLVLNAGAELTDHLPNTASTRAYSTNLWQVTGGFSMAVKPAIGDLFGTQITTIASNDYQTVVHLWAGADRGATVAGFLNNEVIGHLVLDRTAANATLQFSAAGKSNAMYVDYLDLEGLSFSDYHHGLTVDPNFTIYFANANVDPDKLQKVYTNIVWVPQFAGPNSSTNILTEPRNLGGSNVLINVALASSSSIDSSGDGIPNGKSQYPLWNPAVGVIPNPSLVTSSDILAVANTNGVSGQTFVIWTVGQGYVKTNVSLNAPQAGQSVSLTAVPSNNWFFLDWSGPVVTNAGLFSTGTGLSALVTNPALPSFRMPTNVFSFVTANFITNPFIALAGAYNGLFSVHGDVTGGSSGSVSFTVTSLGAFNGKLVIGTNDYLFASQFNLANSAITKATNAARTATDVLNLTLQISDSATSGQATGTVSNAEFSASLLAYQKPAWTAANPAPQAGSYTLVLPGNANAAASPGGDSYGTVTVDVLGNLTAIGTLADNVSFSQGVPLSTAGQWPLYITWIKAAGPGTYYPNGFTNSSVLLGSLYSAAYQQTNGLALRSPTLALTGGNLPAGMTNNVSVSGLETYQTTNKNLTLTIKPSTGMFSGQSVAPGTTKSISLAGVVLQNKGVAAGFFLGTNQSGAVWLQGN
ncbi:MAG: hypothetical protein ABSC18_16730, partial [Verrucomicrobiota bacterium]